MPNLRDGQSVEFKGSARLPYILKNVGGVYSCSCPAWRNQSLAIEQRTCKHLRKYRGDQAEQERLGQALPAPCQPAAAQNKPAVPALLLADSWTPDTDVTGWWLSEKLDGVRAYWDGQRFLSRQGNRFYAPNWFTAGLPDMPLDGERWLARKAFQRTVSIVRRQAASESQKRFNCGGSQQAQIFGNAQPRNIPTIRLVFRDSRTVPSNVCCLTQAASVINRWFSGFLKK